MFVTIYVCSRGHGSFYKIYGFAGKEAVVNKSTTRNVQVKGELFTLSNFLVAL